MLGKFQLYFGILVVVVFLLTGQYMHHKFDHLKEMESVSRALFRTGHLYILLFGLVNMAMGINFKQAKKRATAWLQKAGSAIIMLSTLLVIFAFFEELPTSTVERPLTRICLYLILFGVSVSTTAYFIQQRTEQKS